MKSLIFLAFSITLAAFAADQTAAVRVTWDPHPQPDVRFRVYFGNAPGVYNQSVDVPVDAGNAFTVIGLSPLEDWYFVVTAIDDIGLESAPSNEALWSRRPPAAPQNLRIESVTVVATTMRTEFYVAKE